MEVGPVYTTDTRVKRLTLRTPLLTTDRPGHRRTKLEGLPGKAFILFRAGRDARPASRPKEWIDRTRALDGGWDKMRENPGTPDEMGVVPGHELAHSQGDQGLGKAKRRRAKILRQWRSIPLREYTDTSSRRFFDVRRNGRSIHVDLLHHRRQRTSAEGGMFGMLTR